MGEFRCLIKESALKTGEKTLAHVQKERMLIDDAGKSLRLL